MASKVESRAFAREVAREIVRAAQPKRYHRRTLAQKKATARNFEKMMKARRASIKAKKMAAKRMKKKYGTSPSRL